MKKVIALGIFQIAILLGWAGQNEWIRSTAPTFRIPLRLRDPFDLVRGRYFTVNPEDQEMSTSSSSLLNDEGVARFLALVEPAMGRGTSYSGPALVGFCPAGKIFRVCALRPLGPAIPREEPVMYWCRGILGIYKEKEHYRVRTDLKINKFFLPNQIQLPGRENAAGWELEVSYRPGQFLLPRRLWFKEQPVTAE